MVSFIYPGLTWRPGLLHSTVVLIDMDSARMLVAASNKQKHSSCQNNTRSAGERLGHTEEQLDAREERRRRVKEFWDPSTHPFDCLRPPLSPLPPPLFSFRKPPAVQTKSDLSSPVWMLHWDVLASLSPSLNPFYSQTHIQSPSCSSAGFFFFPQSVALSLLLRGPWGPWWTIWGAMM